MLLVLDVGNTNTVLGVFEARDNGSDATEPRRLVSHWRATTNKSQTVDEYGVLFRNLFSMANLEVSEIHGIVISSVVPPLDPVVEPPLHPPLTPPVVEPVVAWPQLPLP